MISTEAIETRAARLAAEGEAYERQGRYISAYLSRRQAVTCIEELERRLAAERKS